MYSQKWNCASSFQIPTFSCAVSFLEIHKSDLVCIVHPHHTSDTASPPPPQQFRQKLLPASSLSLLSVYCYCCEKGGDHGGWRALPPPPPSQLTAEITICPLPLPSLCVRYLLCVKGGDHGGWRVLPPTTPFPANMSRNYYLPPPSPFFLCTVSVVWREGIMVAGGYCHNNPLPS